MPIGLGEKNIQSDSTRDGICVATCEIITQIDNLNSLNYGQYVELLLPLKRGTKKMKRLMFVLAAMSSLAIGLLSPGALGSVSPALGQPSFQDEWGVRIDFQDSGTPIQITDLSGTPVGDGTHVGQLRCNQNCNHKAQLQSDSIEIKYRFETKQALDPGAGLVIVAGRGTLSSQGQKERFSFTATFEDNQDGTVWVRYDASRPDASFIIPNAPGTLTFFSKQ